MVVNRPPNTKRPCRDRLRLRLRLQWLPLYASCRCLGQGLRRFETPTLRRLSGLHLQRLGALQATLLILIKHLPSKPLIMPPPQSTTAPIPTADDDFWELSSEESDLTELSSSEDEAEEAPPPQKPLRRSSRAQVKDSKEYKVRISPPVRLHALDKFPSPRDNLNNHEQHPTPSSISLVRVGRC